MCRGWWWRIGRIASDGRLAELLAQRISPVYSQPVTGEWIFGLDLARDTNGEFERGVGVFPAGNAGLAEHDPPTYDEHFDVVQGEFIVILHGEWRRAGARDQMLVARDFVV